MTLQLFLAYLAGVVTVPVALVVYMAARDPKARGGLAVIGVVLAVLALVGVIAFNVGRAWGMG